MFLVAEIFRYRQPGQADTQARSGRLGHLAINQRRARLFRIARHDHAGFLEFQPQVIALAGTFAHAGKNGNAAVLHRDVVNQFLNENGFADARASEQADLSAFQERLNQVHDLDARLEHFQRRRLLVERRRRPVDLVSRRAVDGAELIHGLAQHVHHPAERGAAHRHADALSQIVGLHPAHQAFGRLHRHRTHASFAQVLLHLGGHVNWFGNVVAVTGDMDGVVDRWQIAALESHVKHRPDHLHDVSHGSVFFRHAFS